MLGSYCHYVKQMHESPHPKPAMPQAVAQGTRNSAWRPRPVKVENTALGMRLAPKILIMQ